MVCRSGLSHDNDQPYRTDEVRNVLKGLFLRTSEGRGEIRFFAQLPDSAVGASVGWWWDQDRLFRVANTLPVEQIAIDEVRWVLDVTWKTDGRSMNEAKASEGDLQHRVCGRAMAADLSYPIVMARKADRWAVLDGYHRILKADLLHLRTIRAVRLPSGRIREVLRDAGFFGELNAVSMRVPDVLVHAREVARKLTEHQEADADP